MDELVRQLIDYLRGMWLYRWWGLAVAWVVGIGAAGWIYNMPDRYESRARIYVDTRSILAPLMRGLAVQPDLGQQVAIISRTLISRPNIEKLIRMADLDLTTHTENAKEELIRELTSELKINSAGRDNLYTLSYSDTQPDRAKRVVESLMSIFVESGLGDKRKDADSARRFIDEQIRNYELKLSEAENRLKEFKLANINYIGDGKQDYFGQISKVAADLKQARLTLQEAQHSRDSLKQQLASEEPMAAAPQMSQYSMTPELDARIAAINIDLDSLLQRYTEAHPDVVSARRLIADLERQREVKVKEMQEAPVLPEGAMNANPVYQQLKLSLSSAEATVSSLRAREAAYEAQMEELKAAAEKVPMIEEELTQLNRDYGIHKQNYDNLVTRRESANMSSDMEATAGVAEFRVIDPPSQPLKPSAPNRVLLIPLAGLAALCAGAVVTFLLSQVRPTFQDSRALREATGLPILGSVSFVSGPERRRRRWRSLMLFFGGVTSFLGGFALLTLLVAITRGT